MLGAGAVPFRRIDLALGIREASQKIRIFEIYLIHLAVAEMTNFLFCFAVVVVIVVISHIRINYLEWNVFEPDLILLFIQIDGRNLFFGLFSLVVLRGGWSGRSLE